MSVPWKDAARECVSWRRYACTSGGAWNEQGEQRDRVRSVFGEIFPEFGDGELAAAV